MALIGMAVFDNEQNGRTALTARCLESLLRTVDWSRHRLIISDNGSCEATHCLYTDMLPSHVQVIYSLYNRGTARAINAAWKLRKPGEHCVKMDNDILFYEAGWLDKLEECVEREPRIGQLGMKRLDLIESPNNPKGWTHSDLIMLPHKPGQTWLVVESAQHILGSCVLHSSALLDKVGYLYQGGLSYSFDDVLMSARCRAAGFMSCFYPHYHIDHLDLPDVQSDPYTRWKIAYTTEHVDRMCKIRDEYLTGKRSVWQNAEDD